MTIYWTPIYKPGAILNAKVTKMSHPWFLPHQGSVQSSGPLIVLKAEAT